MLLSPQCPNGQAVPVPLFREVSHWYRQASTSLVSRLSLPEVSGSGHEERRYGCARASIRVCVRAYGCAVLSVVLGHVRIAHA